MNVRVPPWRAGVISHRRNPLGAKIALASLILMTCLAPSISPAADLSPIIGRLVDPVALRGVEDVHLEGNLACLPCREGKRLTICSIENPASPWIVSSFTHAELGPAAGFAISGETVYLTSQSNHKLLILDASDKSMLRLVSSVQIGPPGKGILYKVAYQAGYCYVAHLTEKKLFVVDVRDTVQPLVIASVTVTSDNDGPFSVLPHGNHALVGTIFGKRNRLAVVDILNPRKPHLASQVFGPAIGHASGEVLGAHFFAVNWAENAFLVFNVADIAQPKLVAQLVDKQLGNPNRCAVIGDRAYLPMVEGDGVAVVDISDPLNPRFLNSFRHPILDKTYGVAVRNNLIFLGAREGNSLVVLNRSALEK